MLNNKGEINLSKLSDHFGKLSPNDSLKALYLALLEDEKTIKSTAWGVAACNKVFLVEDDVSESYDLMVTFDPYARLDEDFLPQRKSRRHIKSHPLHDRQKKLTKSHRKKGSSITGPKQNWLEVNKNYLEHWSERWSYLYGVDDIPGTAPTQEHEPEDVM
ncbi:hypothetical protein V6N13_072865 [Hibiscus sabdariffa]